MSAPLIRRFTAESEMFAFRKRWSCVKRRLMHTENQDNVKFLTRTPNSSIAFRKTWGKNPGVVFLPGFMSNMNGGKAVALEGFCKRRLNAFVRFDYQGLGESRGDLHTGQKMFNVWTSDALAVLDELTDGPQIMVGSSMGGAIMLLLALTRPERIHALIGIAIAIDFKKTLSYTMTTDEPQEGSASTHSTYTHETPKDLIGAEYQRLLEDEPLPIHQTVRLIHGMRDNVVDFKSSMNLADRLESQDVDVILRKDGGHRMSEEADIKLILNILEQVMDK